MSAKGKELINAISSVTEFVQGTATLVLDAPLLAAPLTTIAQEGTPAAGGPPPIPAGCTVIASGLYNPRGVALSPVENANSVVEVDLATGTTRLVANIGAYEIANNPDPNAIDSNVADVALGADGQLYVADAGGNAIYKVDPASGAISVLAVIPGLPAPAGVANPERGGAAEVDPVPTSIEAAPDGGFYVGLLSGAILWGTPGATKVVHVAADGTITDAATGLDMVVGVATSTSGPRLGRQDRRGRCPRSRRPRSLVPLRHRGRRRWRYLCRRQRDRAAGNAGDGSGPPLRGGSR